MEEQNRVIVLKLETIERELVTIHALEIINDIIAGVYFHAYLNKDIKKYNDMYYLAKYEYFGENYMQNFIDFVGNSKLITYNDEFELIAECFKNNLHENIKLKNNLYRLFVQK